jgi:hypothetical protein
MRGGLNGHRRNSTNDRLRGGSLYRYYDAASGTILRSLVRLSQKKKNPYITFIFDRGRLKVLKPAAHGHKVQIQFYRPSKNIHLVTQSL